MTDVAYKIVEHDGGWAYKVGEVFSETFPSQAEAESMAKQAAGEQQRPGEDEAIEWEDDQGEWHEEAESGSDRPTTRVEEG